MKIILWLMLWLAALPIEAQTLGSNVGTSWLKISPSTRNAGMGDSMMAAGDDYDALDLNPALLGEDRGQFLSFSQNFWVQDLSAQHLVYSFGTDGGDGFGLGVNYMSFGTITNYNVTNSILTTNGSYSPIGLNVYGGYGLGLAPGVRAGITAHFIYDNIQQNYPDQTAAFDGGVYINPSDAPFAIGLVLSNLGWDIDESSLPLEFETSAAYWVLGKPTPKNDDLLTITGQADWYLEGQNYNQYGVGAEYWYKDLIALRAGYQFSNTGGDLTGLTGASLGAGVHYLDWQLDYALITLGNLGVANQISLSMKWGDKEKPAKTLTPILTPTATVVIATMTATPVAVMPNTTLPPPGNSTLPAVNLTNGVSGQGTVTPMATVVMVVPMMTEAVPPVAAVSPVVPQTAPPVAAVSPVVTEMAPAAAVAPPVTSQPAPPEAAVSSAVTPMAPPEASGAVVTPEMAPPVAAVSPVVTEMAPAAAVAPPVTSQPAPPVAAVSSAAPETAPSTTAPVSGVALTGWWGNTFNVETVYSKLRRRVHELITHGEIVQLGKDQKEFFAAAQQQGVSHKGILRMKSGYYTAVAKTLYEMKRNDQADYYLKIALSNQADNAEALKLQQEIQNAAAAPH